MSSSGIEPPSSQRTYRVEGREISINRLAWAMFRLVFLSRTIMIVGYVVALAAAVVLALVERSSLMWFLVVGLALWPLAMYRAMRAQARAFYPPGIWVETVFGSSGLVVRRPQSSAEFDLASIDAIRVIGDAVVLQQGGTKAYTVVPRAVFPDAEVARVEQLIQLRKAGPAPEATDA